MRHPVWLSETEVLPVVRPRITEAMPELPASDKLPATDLVEHLVRQLHMAIVAYVAAHPGRVSRSVCVTTVHMYRALEQHNPAELSTRLGVVVGEVQQNELDAIDPAICQAVEEAERFLRYSK